MAKYLISEWLVGMVDFTIPEATVKAILFNNGVESSSEAATVGEREKDLCLADLYMWLANSSSSTSGEFVSDGGWQHREATKIVSNRAVFRRNALALYKKWDSDKANLVGGNTTLSNLY